MADLFITPNKIIYGKQALLESKDYLKSMGNKALIVTDETMVKIKNVEKLTDVFDNINTNYYVFDKVNKEPTDLIVDKGIELYIKEKCDFVVALGGGSPIDTAKAIAAMITNEGSIDDYINKELKNMPVNIVAIPTTAGTGSEATQFTIISNTRDNIKMLLKGEDLVPKLAIIDAQFTATAPKSVIAATGIDALTHAIESYTSIKANSLSKNFSLSAFKRIFNNLRKAYSDSNDIDAKTEMSIGALEAGIAFNNSSVTIIHGMSRPIGALFHIPHGVSNAVLLVECLKFAVKGQEDIFGYLAKKSDICNSQLDDSEACDILIKEIDKLCKDINIPSLKELGVVKEEFLNNLDKMAQDAINSGSPANTRHNPTKGQIIDIYKKLF